MMLIAVFLAFVGAMVALVCAFVLMRRFVDQRHLHLLGWMMSALALAISLGGQTLGSAITYDATTFRVVILCGALLAPLWSAWGCIELIARGTPPVFCARLLVAAYTIVPGVILMSDPLQGANKFTTALPPVSGHYMTLPTTLLTFGYLMSALAVIVAAGLAIARREEPDGPARLLAAVFAAGSALFEILGAGFGVSGVIEAFLLVVSVSLLWYAGTRGAVPPDELDEEEEEEFADLHRGRRARRQAQEAGGRRRRHSEPEDTGPLPTGEHPYGGRRERPVATSGPPTTAMLDELANEQPADAGGLSPDLYGFISIFTLHEDRGQEFDSLAEDLVEQVKDAEPGTLMFVCHSVPSAPQQRIFYEMYRDRDAHAEHESRPYVQRFRSASTPCLLATNVIELNVNAAKASALGRESAAEVAAVPRPRSHRR